MNAESADRATAQRMILGIVGLTVILVVISYEVDARVMREQEVNNQTK